MEITLDWKSENLDSCPYTDTSLTVTSVRKWEIFSGTWFPQLLSEEVMISNVVLALILQSANIPTLCTQESGAGTTTCVVSNRGWFGTAYTFCVSSCVHACGIMFCY